MIAITLLHVASYPLLARLYRGPLILGIVTLFSSGAFIQVKKQLVCSVLAIASASARVIFPWCFCCLPDVPVPLDYTRDMTGFLSRLEASEDPPPPLSVLLLSALPVAVFSLGARLANEESFLSVAYVSQMKATSNNGADAVFWSLAAPYMSPSVTSLFEVHFCLTHVLLSMRVQRLLEGLRKEHPVKKFLGPMYSRSSALLHYFGSSAMKTNASNLGVKSIVSLTIDASNRLASRFTSYRADVERALEGSDVLQCQGKHILETLRRRARFSQEDESCLEDLGLGDSRGLAAHLAFEVVFLHVLRGSMSIRSGIYKTLLPGRLPSKDVAFALFLSYGGLSPIGDLGSPVPRDLLRSLRSNLPEGEASDPFWLRPFEITGCLT
jgi:hypothetical protein